jgi:hypothetical protein
MIGIVVLMLMTMVQVWNMRMAVRRTLMVVPMAVCRACDLLRVLVIVVLVVMDMKMDVFHRVVYMEVHMPDSTH